jgi:5-methylcytosine-specific restriction endonuclease McrA
MPGPKLCRKAYDLLHRRVLEPDGWRRQVCGSSENLQVHHVKFRSKLGDDEPSNLIGLCALSNVSNTGLLGAPGPAGHTLTKSAATIRAGVGRGPLRKFE